MQLRGAGRGERRGAVVSGAGVWRRRPRGSKLYRGGRISAVPGHTRISTCEFEPTAHGREGLVGHPRLLSRIQHNHIWPSNSPCARWPLAAGHRALRRPGPPAAQAEAEAKSQPETQITTNDGWMTNQTRAAVGRWFE